MECHGSNPLQELTTFSQVLSNTSVILRLNSGHREKLTHDEHVKKEKQNYDRRSNVATNGL